MELPENETCYNCLNLLRTEAEKEKGTCASCLKLYSAPPPDDAVEYKES